MPQIGVRDGQRQQRRGDDPGVGGLAAAEVGDDLRQRGRDDGAREDRDEHPEQQARDGLQHLAVGHARLQAGWVRATALMRRSPWVAPPCAGSPRGAGRARAASATTSSSSQPAMRGRERLDHAAVRLAQHARPGLGDADAARAAVVLVGLAADVARALERGDLAAGDGDVDAQALGDVADPQRAVLGDHGERREALRAELGERVAGDLPVHQAQLVQGADEVLDGGGGGHVGQIVAFSKQVDASATTRAPEGAREKTVGEGGRR